MTRRLSVQVRPTRYGLEKRCVTCLEWLPLDECFNRNPRGAFGRENACRACRNETRAAKRASGDWRTSTGWQKRAVVNAG